MGDDDGGVRRRARWRLRGTVLGTTGDRVGGATVLGTIGVGTGGTSLRESKLFVEAKRTCLLDEDWAFFRADFSARRTLALLRVLPM